jgi:AcrR family transcriptional regulator
MTPILRKKPPSKPAIRKRIREQKVALIQDQILEVAAELIAERGFKTVTSEDISAAMGFTKSIIYYYFENKNEILWRIFEKIDGTYSDSLSGVLAAGGSPEKVLAEIMRLHSMNVMTHKSWATIYNRDEHELGEDQRKIVATNKRKYNKQVEDVYKAGIAAGTLKPGSATVAVACMLGACNWTYTWFKPTGALSAQQIADAFATQLIEGVLA